MIDLLSDTVTLPTKEMRRAMFEAEVGDSGYGEDPTVDRLESLAAKMLGKEDAAFVSSGCQGNLTALLAHCPRGYEVILGDRSDLYDFEAGSASVVGGASPASSTHGTRWSSVPAQSALCDTGQERLPMRAARSHRSGEYALSTRRTCAAWTLYQGGARIS